MYSIQLLLPIHDNQKDKFPAELFASVREELANRFGGVTAFVRSPAVGLWNESGDVNRDEVVVYEVLAEELETHWWSTYRQTLEQRFRQEEILIWGTQIDKL